MERLHGLRLPSQKYPQYAARLPLHADKLGRPNFMLAGLAIGNGLTDPESQAPPPLFLPLPKGVPVRETNGMGMASFLSVFTYSF
jgi:hypothetical protein